MNHTRSCVSVSRAHRFQENCQRAARPQSAGIVPLQSRSYAISSASRAQWHLPGVHGNQPTRSNGILYPRAATYLHSSQRLASSLVDDIRRPGASNAPNDNFLPDSLEGLEERDPSAIPSDVLPALPDDHVGFLSENYGLDFGWGTSSMMKLAFENIHLFSGFEFWGSIVATGIFARLLILPFLRISSDNVAKMQAMSKVATPLQARLKAASSSGNMVERQKARNELRAVYKQAGIKPWKMILAFVQMPIGFGCWRTFSNMAHMPVAGMTTGGALWFTNLTVPDPFLILPFATCAMQYITGRWNSETNSETADPATQKTQRVLMTVLPCVFFPFVAFAPAAVQLHFLTTASIAVITNIGFRNNTVRSLLRMTPRISKADAPPAAFYAGTINVAATSRPTRAAPSSAASKPAPEPAQPPPSMNPITRMRYAAGRAQTFLKESAGAVKPDWLQKAENKASSSASRYDERRRREIAKEKEAYEKQLERMRMKRKMR